MKVYGKCKSCKAEIGYQTDANTRVEFAMQEGETVVMNCKNCGTNTKFQVDELYAKHSNKPIVAASLVVLTGVIFILYLLFFSEGNYVFIAFGLPFVIYFVLKKQDQRRVSDFNKRKVKGRIHNMG